MTPAVYGLTRDATIRSKAWPSGQNTQFVALLTGSPDPDCVAFWLLRLVASRCP